MSFSIVSEGSTVRLGVSENWELCPPLPFSQSSVDELLGLHRGRVEQDYFKPVEG